MAEARRLIDIQLEMLTNELNHITGTIRQHDEMTKSIKNWALVTWTASIGFALKDEDLHTFVWMTAIVPIVFWIVDGSFRGIQRSFITRFSDISNYVNSAEFMTACESGAPLAFKLLLMRRKTGRFKDSFPGTMLFRSVWLFYVGLAACSLVAWLIAN